MNSEGSEMLMKDDPAATRQKCASSPIVGGNGAVEVILDRSVRVASSVPFLLKILSLSLVAAGSDPFPPMFLTKLTALRIFAEAEILHSASFL